MDALRKPAVWIALLAALLGLALLGARGIWDPDEGRYTNVGLNMLDSGDWLVPRRNDEIGHWTKPPMTYWAIASSVAVFGSNPWAARLPAAASYLLCVWLVWRMGRRLSPGSEAPAALAYATMLLPIGAAHLITTDYVLTACSTFAMHGFVQARFGGARPRWWIATVWVGFALAFLTKGPPGLLPMLAIVAFDLAMPGRREHRLLQWPGIALFLLIALPWYIAVVMRTPGLLHYFVGSEVVNRVASDSFSRHGEWYGWIVVFGPTLLIGTLPWTLPLLRFLRRLPADARRWWRDRAQRTADAPWVFLVLWVLLPLIVFCIARSRMPLYLLPLWAPLALLVAMQRGREGRALPRARWIVAWVVLVLGLQLVADRWPTHKDAAMWADAIRERAGGQPVRKVVFVEDMTRYGLHVHLGLATRIDKIALQPLPQSPSDRIYDDLIDDELRKAEPGAIWICKASAWPKIRMRIEIAGYTPVMLPPFRDRLFFRVVPTAGPRVAPR
jgi:4-amino-4-deoxy-L-arabinose transferase-like glycosyltransferase